MEEITALWVRLPHMALAGLSQARELPYPALHILGLTFVVALPSTSLAAMLLVGVLTYIAGAVLLTHPGDPIARTVLWTACSASLVASGISFHRRLLARRVSLLRDKVGELRRELDDLRPRYERELMWRKAGERTPEAVVAPSTSDELPKKVSPARSKADAAARFPHSWHAQGTGPS